MVYCYLALIAWLPLPFGNNRPWATSITEVWIYFIAGFIIIQWLRQPQAIPTPFKTSYVTLVLLALNLLWLLIQCMPIPLSLLQTLSPLATDLYIHSGITSYASISLDSTVTFYQFQTALFLFTLFLLTLYLIDSEKKLRWLVYTILLSALFQSMYGALMILTGIEYSFFISKSEIQSTIGSATGTFANRDHLAGYLEMALALGIGLMLTMLSNSRNFILNWKQRIREISELLLGSKARLRIILILLCLGLVLTHSRGGNISFFISLGVTGILFLAIARNKPRATTIFLSSLLILDIVVIGSLVGASEVINRLAETSTQTETRDDAYLATYPMLKDYFITGIGAGNYFNVFPSYKTPLLNEYWRHSHNDYLEIMVEQGIIGFSLLAGVVLFSIFTAIQLLRTRRNPFVLGMCFASLMGTFSLLIHSAVDFNLQILANSSVFMIILAIPFICHNLNYKQKGSRRSSMKIDHYHRHE